MSANQPNTETGGGTRVVFTGEQRNPVLTFIQRPRILLLMLAAWSILGVLTQVFTESAVFFDNHGKEIDGALGGFALGWEGVPLAAVYIYAFRNPIRHRPVYWLALIHMAALAASQLYHLGTGDFSFESLIVPLFGSLGLAALVFLHLFGPKETPAEALKAD